MTTTPESALRTGRTRRTILLLGATVLVALGAWQAGLKHRFVPKNFGVVEPGQIYRSGRLTTGTLAQVVKAHDIKTVIDFGAYDTRPEQFERIREADARLGVTRHVLPLYGDATGDPYRYVEALRVLADERNHPVLVQCAAGAQRTGMCVVLYQTILKDRPLLEVYAESFEHGHDPSDNWRFPVYLGRWQDDIEASYRSGEPIPTGDVASTPDDG